MQFKTQITPFAVGRRCNSEEWNTITRVLEGTTNVGFGVPVTRGTGPKQFRPLGGGREIIGITEADQTLPRPGDYFAQYDNAGICEVGVIGVLAGGDVAHGAPAGYDPAANDGAGGWVVADTGVDQVPGAQFETSGAAGETVALRYRRPVPSA